MSEIRIRNARVLTMLAPGESRPPASGRRGLSMRELGVLPAADVRISGGTIEAVEAPGTHRGPVEREIDAAGRVLMPGFVDCHTHACWAGSRIDEWERKLAGATYQEIMAAGGGIMSTVRAIRTADRAELATILARHASGSMLVHGTTTAEVKSGYGLTTEHELKMLAAIRDVAEAGRSRITVVPTALLGHAIDGQPERFVQETIERTLPAVSAAFPGIAVDAFCEKGAWSADDCLRLFTAAKASGHSIRVHADQFTSLGMVECAIAIGARSADHLEASTPDTMGSLAASETFAVGLPVCGFHLDGRYAPLGKIAALGGKICIATNYNPGSAPCPSMPFAIALAVRHCGLSPVQAIVASTVNPALLLGFADRGYIAPSARADVLLLKHDDERGLAYEVGDNPVATVIAGGQIIE